MKFFVDANLHHKLALNLRDRGFDVLHTDDPAELQSFSF